MNWFQRYGIPGVYFWGFVTLWILAFSKFDLVNTADGVKIKDAVHVVAAITAVFFLPAGYLITMVAQTIYLFFPLFSVHRKAMRDAGVSFGTGTLLGRKESECRLGALSYVYTLYTKREGNDGELVLTKIRHIQEGLRKRFDVMTIDFSLFLATFFAFAFSLLFLQCFECTGKTNLFLIVLLVCLSLAVLLFTFANWFLLRLETAKMIEGLFRFMAAKSLSSDDQSVDFIVKKDTSR